MKPVLLITFLLSTLWHAAASQGKSLDYFMSQALQNSPLLKDYQFQIQSNTIDSQRIRAGYGLQINGNSTGTYAPVINGWGYDETITNLHTYNAMVGFTQTLAGKKNISNQYRTLQLQNLGLQNLGKITEQDVKRSITQQYITAYGDLQQINFNQEMLSLLKVEDTILKKLTEKGVYKQTDYLSFLVNIQQQELLVKQIRNQYQNDLATLRYIAGLTDTAYLILDTPVLTLKELPRPEQSVFYEQFQIDSMKISAKDRQIDFSYKPKINWYGDGGYNSSFITTPYKNLGLSAGVTLAVPIYDGKQRKIQHQKNTIAEQNRKGYQDFFRNQYSQQISRLKQQLLLTETLIEQTTAQIRYAETLINAQRQQLVTGDVHIADYIIAVSNYLNAKNMISQNIINKLQIINQINYWNRKP